MEDHIVFGHTCDDASQVDPVLNRLALFVGRADPLRACWEEVRANYAPAFVELEGLDAGQLRGRFCEMGKEGHASHASYLEAIAARERTRRDVPFQVSALAWAGGGKVVGVSRAAAQVCLHVWTACARVLPCSPCAAWPTHPAALPARRPPSPFSTSQHSTALSFPTNPAQAFILSETACGTRFLAARWSLGADDYEYELVCRWGRLDVAQRRGAWRMAARLRADDLMPCPLPIPPHPPSPAGGNVHGGQRWQPAVPGARAGVRELHQQLGRQGKGRLGRTGSSRTTSITGVAQGRSAAQAAGRPEAGHALRRRLPAQPLLPLPRPLPTSPS